MCMKAIKVLDYAYNVFIRNVDGAWAHIDITILSYYHRDNLYSANKNFLSRFLEVSMKGLHIAKLHILL